MGGHIIIRHSIKDTLGDPMNNAALPDSLRPVINSILSADPSTWVHADCAVLAHAVGWLMIHNPTS